MSEDNNFLRLYDTISRINNLQPLNPEQRELFAEVDRLHTTMLLELSADHLGCVEGLLGKYANAWSKLVENLHKNRTSQPG